MELAPRMELMSWLVSQGLTGLPEPDLIRGFCERCRAAGLDLSLGLAFIDTFVIPFLGFLFLPWTTLAYAVAQNSFGGLHDIGLLLVILGVLADVGVFGGGARYRNA